MSDTQKRPPTPEQAARDMLERIDMPDAQSLCAGDVGEISQAIAESWEVQRLRARVADLDAREAEAAAVILRGWRVAMPSNFVECTCPGWVKSMPFIYDATELARTHGTHYAGDVFALCPWCGKRFSGMSADDERLQQAGERVGLVFGCDTPEIMADQILELRARMAAIESAARIDINAANSECDSRDCSAWTSRGMTCKSCPCDMVSEIARVMGSKTSAAQKLDAAGKVTP